MYKTILPPKDLEGYISFFYVMEKEVKDLKHQQKELLMPSGTAIVGFHYLGNWILHGEEFLKSKQVLNMPTFYVAGQQTISYDLTISKNKTGILGAALKPTTLWKWLKIPMYTLTNEVVNSAIIFGSDFEIINNNFKKLYTEEERLACVIDFFRNLSKDKLSNPSMVEVALDEIYSKKGCITIKELLQKTGLKERSLQQSFKKEVGISPLQYARIIRFNNVFVEIAKDREDLDLAFLTAFYNYYDASHLNKDFKSYLGEAPSAFTLEKYELLQELIKEIPYLIQVQQRKNP